MPKYPFEASPEELQANADTYVDSVFSCLTSAFLELPKGPGFIEYGAFEQAYETLKRESAGFSNMSLEKILNAVLAEPITFIVLRTMLGFTPPEWAYLATQDTSTAVTQGFARTWDRKVRMAPLEPVKPAEKTRARLEALVRVACRMLTDGAPKVKPDRIHRLDKADTKEGAQGIRTAAGIGVPYAMLLYERFLGRPFAGHRDSISEMIGDSLESAVEDVLTQAGVSFRKTKRAERISGFDQVPDFLIPSEYNPKVIIEAKLTEDDGTARDKVTRIQHLCELSRKGMPAGRVKYEVIACIAGRGFGVRREDMKKLLLATGGKVFTPKTLNRMVEHTRLKEFRTRQ